MPLLKARFASRTLADIRVADIDDLVQDLKTKGRKPATINRYLALLRRMLNWAVEREYLDRTPFRRGSQAVIKLEREHNRRSRRLTAAEEKRLLAKASPMLQAMIITALDTGMRCGELMNLRFGDVDLERQLMRVRWEIAKSKRERLIPIATTRLRALLDWLRIDAAGGQKADVHPCSRIVLESRSRTSAGRGRALGNARSCQDCGSTICAASTPLDSSRKASRCRRCATFWGTHRSSRRNGMTVNGSRRCRPQRSASTLAKVSRFFQVRSTRPSTRRCLPTQTPPKNPCRLTSSGECRGWESNPDGLSARGF
jgi:hypothetical protein